MQLLHFLEFCKIYLQVIIIPITTQYIVWFIPYIFDFLLTFMLTFFTILGTQCDFFFHFYCSASHFPLMPKP